MTTIDRLGLLGIRSYGTEEETFIRFFKPLTIILGRNGSGKSTIIEAVKMATTGDLPPNVGTGAAFIHDPRISNETETKAKIRLMFTNVKGDQYIVARHFQLNIKRNPRANGSKTEFKRLDQTVRRSDGSASSYRCSDFNALLPDILRVTKPVLNNVIFVHQEDSLWPLSEPKKLKERFDEIFAASRYTKAMETIRKYRKAQAVELKTVAVELLRYEDKVQILEKVRAEVEEIREKYDALSKGVSALEGELSALKNERQSAQNLAEDYSQKLAELEKLTIEVSILEKDKATKYSEMELHLPDMDEQALRTEIEDQQKFLDRADGERASRAKLIENLAADVEMRRREHQSRQTRKGMLEQLANVQSERLCRLEDLKREFRDSKIFEAVPHSKISSSSLPSVSENREIWTAALDSSLRDMSKEVEKLTEHANQRVDAAVAVVGEIKLKTQDVQGKIDRGTIEISQKRTKLSSIRNELNSLDDTQSSVVRAEGTLKVIERAWKEKCASSRTGELSSSIKSKRQEISSLREELSVLRRTREELVHDQQEQAKLEVCRETLIKKKNHFRTFLEDFSDLLITSASELQNGEEDSSVSRVKNELTQLDPVSDSNTNFYRQKLMDACNRILARRDTILQQAERSLSECTSSLNTALSRKSEAEREFDIVKHELDEAEHNLFREADALATFEEISEVEQVSRMLSETKMITSEGGQGLQRDNLGLVESAKDKVDVEVVKVTQRISQLETGVFLAEGDLEQFEADPKHHCPACGLSSSKKVDDMRKRLRSRVEYFKNPESTRAAQGKLQKLKAASQTFKRMYSLGSTASNLLRSHEAAYTKVRDARAVVHELERKARDAKTLLNSIRQRIGESSCIAQIDSKRLELKQIHTDLERAQKELNLAQAGLSVANSGARPLSEVESESRQTDDKMQRIQDDVDRETRTLEQEREELQRAETRFHAAKQQCLELQTMAEKHRRLNAEKTQLQTELRSLESAIESSRAEIKELSAELDDAETELQVVRTENSHSVKNANNAFSNAKMKVEGWKDCARELEAYIQSGREAELGNLLKSLSAIDADIEAKVRDLKSHEREQQRASDSQKHIESKIRNLRDNQRFRLQEQELSVLNRSIRHMRDQTSTLEQQAQGNPIDQVKELSDKINSKNASWHATRGKKQVYTDRYKEKQKELAAIEKQGSRRKYDECRIRKQTIELAMGDLERYYQALDQALMAFHTLKMNSINRTIKELWQQTYRGTDIDEIEIISDDGDPQSTSIGAAKRSFSYRVQMRRGQATLEMRGRCSAGQKVLACLVIRLALADSFCSDCGILALDEPTTNLDRENIESLAVALKQIIEYRQKQRNFQLVLITHDQEFIEMLAARNFANEYCVIYKDPTGVSQARVMPMQEFG